MPTTIQTHIENFLTDLLKHLQISLDTKPTLSIEVDSFGVSWGTKERKEFIRFFFERASYSFRIDSSLPDAESLQAYLDGQGRIDLTEVVLLYRFGNDEPFIVDIFQNLLSSPWKDIREKLYLTDYQNILFTPHFSDLLVQKPEFEKAVAIIKQYNSPLFARFSLKNILLYESLPLKTKKIAGFFLEKTSELFPHYSIDDILFLSLYLGGLQPEFIKVIRKDLLVFSYFFDFFLPTIEELQIFIHWETETKKLIFSTIKELYPFRDVLETGLLDLYDFTELSESEQTDVLNFLTKRKLVGSRDGTVTLFSILRESGRGEQMVTTKALDTLQNLLEQKDGSFRQSPHVLLYCLQRSGSSLYHKLLSEIIKYYGLQNPCIIDDVYNIKFPENTITEHSPEMQSVIRKIEESYPNDTANQNLAFLKLWCPQDSVLYGTCRDMLSSDFSLLPNMRFIVLTRDPRDIYLSMRAKDEVATLAWVIKERVKMETYIETVRCNHILSVKYEDLMANFKEEYCRLIDFLGLSFNSEIFDIIQKSTSFETMSGGRKYGEIVDGAYFRGGSDWRKEFTPYEKQYCQERYGQSLSKWGYYW